ncbi:TRAP transporter substrate-binding protein [Roseomonas sp. NAR14]|uniref:TRAP transporter substrate-binding protein n=1 Tax=Roseomonas acroporae TaxID=2937791 RepID=A0A9X2BVU5_9PROT|nr:TRAP transporter substrate-binding protein [Roseomonas acroporae]MCK8785456.1 TRAP transporter substrate-binding protein [Roseomonas acroporae]
MRRRTLLALPLTAPAVSSALAGQTAVPAAGATDAMATEYPANAMPGEGVAHFTAALTRLSGGALTLTPSFDAALGIRSAGMLAAVREGRLPAADAFAGSMAADDPLFLLSSLPFLTASFADARRLYDAARPAYAEALAGRGARLLYATPWPPSGLWTRTPLRQASQLDGLRVRTYDATGTEVLRAAGAQAEVLSFADVMTRLRTGTLDAVLSSGDGGAGRRLWEQLPSFTVLNYAWPLSLAFFSEARWQSLSPTLREAVAAAALETEARQWAAIGTRIEANRATMRANGVTLVADPEPALGERLTQAARRTVEDWTARVGERGAAVLRRYGGPQPR